MKIENVMQEAPAWIEENGLGEHGGASIKQFTEAMGIDRATFYKWMKKPSFSSMIAEAKAMYRAALPNDLIRSLKQAAMGGEYEQVTTVTEDDAEGNPRTRETRKNVRQAPNVQAAIFLLTNIEPDEWKNRQSTDHKVEVEAFKYPALSEEQMREAIAMNQALLEAKQ